MDLERVLLVAALREFEHPIDLDGDHADPLGYG